MSESQTPDAMDEGVGSSSLLAEVLGDDAEGTGDDLGGEDEDEHSDADSDEAMSIDGDADSDVTVETPPRPPETSG